MNRAILLILISIFSSTVNGGDYLPKTINLIVSQPIEIYHVSASCWLHEYEGQESYESGSVYLDSTTDLSIRDTVDYCNFHTYDVTTSCHEHMQPYMDVISESGICEMRNYSYSAGSAGIDALCRGQRSSLVNMIYELCEIMLNTD